MMEVELISYKITKLDMRNDLKDSCAIELANTASFHINYDMDNRIAVTTLKETVSQRKHPNQFYIELTIEGTFLLDKITSDYEKEIREMHVKCYNELFPFANQVLSLLGTNSGMQGLTIRKVPIKPESVHFGPKPDDEKSGKIVRLCLNDE